MMFTITPMQLAVYLQFAIKYAEEHQADLPLAKDIVKKLMQVKWDEDAELLICEKPF